MSGGGSSGPTTSTNYTNSVPPELMPYATDTLGKASALTSTPYQQYPGQQVADFSPLQNQAFGNIQQMQPNAATNQATGLAGLGATNQFSGANVGNYMTPYMQNVVNQQSNAAIADYGRSLPQLGSAAGAVGGLGGSREALMQSEANRNLQNQLSSIQATGSQNAFQNAQQQFNQQNQNLMQGAGVLGGLGTQQFQQAAGINTALLGAGSLQQQQAQTGLNTSYQNFLNQQNYPYSQLGFMSSLIRGTPTTQSQSSIYQQPPNVAGQVAGLGLGLGSLFGALG